MVMEALGTDVKPSPFVNGAFLDAHATLAWIAWRLRNWQPHVNVNPDPAREAAELERAHGQLLTAVGMGQLAAFGCRAAVITVGSDMLQFRPAAEPVEIPKATFAAPGIRIHRHGYVTMNYLPPPPPGTTETPLYLSVRFSRSDVERLWPVLKGAEKRLARNAERMARRIADEGRATAWMASNFTEQKPWKCAAAIAACRAETKVPFEVARAALKTVPQEVRGQRGKHKAPVIG